MNALGGTKPQHLIQGDALKRTGLDTDAARKVDQPLGIGNKTDGNRANSAFRRDGASKTEPNGEAVDLDDVQLDLNKTNSVDADGAKDISGKAKDGSEKAVKKEQKPLFRYRDNGLVKVGSIPEGLVVGCARNKAKCILLTAGLTVGPIVLQNMIGCGQLLPIPNACAGVDDDKEQKGFDEACVSDFSACYGACLPENFDPLQSVNAATLVYRTRETYANELVERCSAQEGCTLTNQDVATMVTDSTEGMLYSQPSG